MFLSNLKLNEEEKRLIFLPTRQIMYNTQCNGYSATQVSSENPLFKSYMKVVKYFKEFLEDSSRIPVGFFKNFPKIP